MNRPTNSGWPQISVPAAPRYGAKPADAPRVLLVPGLRDSGPGHWQTWWQSQEPCGRVIQDDWSAPDLDIWAGRVAEALAAADRPVWLVAHSFGCLASVKAGLEQPERVAGALLVAPANPDRFGVRSRLPAAPLPFPSRLVASLDDPWMSYADAEAWAARWQSTLICLGRVGHINAESGFGPWPEGRRLLADLQAGPPVPETRRCCAG